MKRIDRAVMVLLVILGLLGSMTAQAVVDPFTAVAWALGFFTQQPKTFHSAEFDFEIYTTITAEDLELVHKYYPNLQLKVGDKLYINPETIFSQFDGKGLLLRLLSERKWIVHFSIPQSRDTIVHSGKIIIYRGVEPKSEQEISESEVVFEHNFSSNDFSFVLPIAINGMAYSCSVYIEKPTRTNGYGYFRYYSKPAAEYAREFDSSKVVGTLIYGNQLEEQKANADQYRTEKLTLLGRLEPETNSQQLGPVSIVVQDKYGEVYRGLFNGKIELKVSSEGVRIFKGTGEITELSSNPACESGCFKINSGQENVILIYPWREKITISTTKNTVSQILRGQVKIYAPKGSQIPVEVSASGEGSSKGTVTIEKFGGKVTDVWTDDPQTELTVKVWFGGKCYVRTITPDCDQVIFDFESKTPVKNYNAINTNPAVPGGVKTKAKLAEYAGTDHFTANTVATGADLKEIEILRGQAQNGEAGVAIVGPEEKTFYDNGHQVMSTTLVKSLTECGPNGWPIGHQNFYRITFDSYHRVWVPRGRYGWVIGIIMDCGNAVMIYIKPPSPAPVCIRPPKLPSAPEINLPEFSFFVGKSSGNVTSSVITPSSVVPLVATPSTKIDIKTGDVINSLNNSSSSSSSSAPSQVFNPTNISSNTNINSNPIDINQTQNNIQQTQINNTNNNP